MSRRDSQMFIEGVNYAYWSNWLYYTSPPTSPYHDNRMSPVPSPTWPVNPHSHSYTNPLMAHHPPSGFPPSTGVGPHVTGYPTASPQFIPPHAYMPPYSMQPNRTFPGVNSMQHPHSTPVQNSATMMQPPRTPVPTHLATPPYNIPHPHLQTPTQLPTHQVVPPQYTAQPNSVVPGMPSPHHQQPTTKYGQTPTTPSTTSKEFVINQISNSEQNVKAPPIPSLPSVDRLA